MYVLKDTSGADYFIPILRLSTWVKASNNTSSNLKCPQRDIKLGCLRNQLVKAHLCSQHHHTVSKQNSNKIQVNKNIQNSLSFDASRPLGRFPAQFQVFSIQYLLIYMERVSNRFQPKFHGRFPHNELFLTEYTSSFFI